MRLFDNPNSTAGKMTVSLLIAGFAVFLVLFSFDLQHEYVVQKVQAQDYATTTVQVLNTPPIWTLNAQEEAPGSATSTPTNATSSLNFIAIGTDSNAEDYFLIICSTATAPTANADAPPTCDGGAANTWAVSPTTTSGTVATATYATLVSDNEVNEWWASICDANTGTPRCNTQIQQGDKANDTATSSPFHVNHRPNFTVASNTGPVDPGSPIVFTSTSSDPDALGGDTVQLFVCRTQAFDYTNLLCPGGAWATSTAAGQDVATTTTIQIPTQDGQYNAYFYVVDNHGFATLEGVTTAQATNSPFTVNNVAPTVATATISLNYGGPMAPTVPEGETTGFTLTFKVRDNNSCVANASTTDEFNSAVVGIYRSGVTSANCDEGSEFDTNSCYHTATGTAWWNTTLVATTTDTCTGPDDLTRDYEFTFPLWYNADPTAGASLTDSTWFAENWIASVIVDDDDFATSTVATSSGVEMNALSAFDVVQTSISYGSLEPGNTTTPVLGAPVATTTVRALGNIGIDQNLLGEDMCSYYQTFGDCWTHSSTSTIGAEQQRYSTTTDTYIQATTDGNVISSTTPSELEVNVPKTTSTSSPATGDITWGIAIPASITFSGTYFGQNTFQVVPGEAQDW